MENNDYNEYMTLPSSLLPDLNWWLSSIMYSNNSIKDDNNYCLEIFSDASTTGWGASCGDQRASGRWSQEEIHFHINQLELLAAYFALKIFSKNYSNCNILMRVDNTTAISYINRMGGIQYPHLSKVARDIWQWCEVRKLFVFASYIKSSDNIIADQESRRTHPDVEWELSLQGYEILLKNLSVIPVIDLFATRVNKKCVKFVSWFNDPDAFTIDAFTLDWSKIGIFYAFPPVAIIPKVLRKIIVDKAEGIVVVPLWPTQPWYPMFLRLLASKLVYIDCNNFYIPDSSHRNIHRNITLVAGILSGQRCYNEKSQVLQLI
ncbi:uncharacterized protein LOC121732959 [Aricia agestis]|uniref:uncharacterized protein LOC121732959 n=1 Tax=Aricia agestis TaxID=91739 RepID=UPI001C20A813|nr:uncharacterized protein LOC121732959 [Aricia agestis]